jgi:glyoxylase-like metal-dependent hydrolase (beta-lactamase superfamily II)
MPDQSSYPRLLHRTLLACLFLAGAVSIQAEPATRLTFSVLKTAQSAGGLEATMFDGGSWFKVRKLVHCAVLVRHPRGDFLYDTGIGKEVASQTEVFSFLDRRLLQIEGLLPAVEQFHRHGYDPAGLMAIIPSHLHWDHASGIEDFTPVPVWVQQDGRNDALAGQPPSFLRSQYDAPDIQWQPLVLDERAYEGFPHSLDLFQDGSVVLVDLSGHTRGQVGMFLNFPDGERYFFIGDTTWVLEGITRNLSRPWLTQTLVGVDRDVSQNARVIQKIHELSKADPALIIVPAHDENVLQTLPAYPQFR